MKKKILFLIKLPPPVTGATLMNQRINNSTYLQNKFTIRTVSASYAKDVSLLNKFHIKKLLIFCVTICKLLIELISYKPDLVYFQISPLGMAFLRDSLLVILIKLFRRKIVFHIRGKGIQKRLNGKNLLARYYKFIFYKTDVICLSELLTYDMKDFELRKIHIVNNGLPDHFTNEVKKNKESLKVLYLSNLMKEKGILDFIDAVEIVVNKGYDIEAIIIGKESDISAEELNWLIESKNISNNVTYDGPKYGDDKYKILNNCDILVFPTYYSVEAFPGVVIEGMQFGLPVISTTEASIPVMIDDGITGFLVDQQSPIQNAEKIEYFVNNREMIKQMGKAGRKKYLAKYTFDKYERNIENVFMDVLDN